MRIAVIGASGWLGGAIAREALAPVIADHDVVVSAVTDRSGPDQSTIPAVARTLIEAEPEALAQAEALEAPQFSRRRFTAVYVP